MGKGMKPEQQLSGTAFIHGNHARPCGNTSGPWNYVRNCEEMLQTCVLPATHTNVEQAPGDSPDSESENPGCFRAFPSVLNVLVMVPIETVVYGQGACGFSR